MVTWAHFHLLSVHLPVVGIPLLGVILLVGLSWKKVEVRKVALLGILLTSLFTIPIYLSGEEAEEQVEHLKGISEHQIEEHEEAALAAFVVVLLAGATSGLALLAPRFFVRYEPHALRSAIILTLLASALLGYTANQGGKIRHSVEISGKPAKASFQK